MPTETQLRFKNSLCGLSEEKRKEAEQRATLPVLSLQVGVHFLPCLCQGFKDMNLNALKIAFENTL